MGTVVALLMVLSGFGVYLSGKGAQGEVVTEYGVRFRIDQNLQVYVAKLQGQQQYFSYLPSTLSGLPVSDGTRGLITDAQVLVITFDPNASTQNLQIMDALRFELSTTLGVPVISAVAAQTPSYTLPILSCVNATAQLPVLSLEVAEEPSITLDGACLRLAANETGFLQLRDRLLYELYGVYEGDS